MNILFYGATLIMMFCRLTGSADYSWITILAPSFVWWIWLLICAICSYHSLKRAYQW